MFKLNSNELNTIIKSFSQCKQVVIRACKIVIDTHIDFTITNDYKTDYLDFGGTGGSYYSNWKGKPLDFDKIVKAISECGLKQSLNTLGVKYCGFDNIDQAKAVLTKYDCTEVKVTEYELDPYEF